MRRLPVYTLYILTGALGLTYEVVWSRYLALMIGNTAHAHTAVLATFMGGLALGAWIFGSIADRARHGLKLYGWLELVIGLYGVFFPEIFELWSDLLGPVAGGLEPGSGGMAAFKLLFAVLCILPPTILMGGTLPILTRYLADSTAGLRGSVSALYALNAGGAVVGGLLAGFVLIVELGLPVTISGAGLVNAGLGLLAVLLGLIYPARVASERGVGREDAEDYDARAQRTAIWLAGFSGFATMTLEVAWIRWFGLMLGSSTYAFTLMLAAFITGIALGSWWLSRPRAGRLPLLPLLAGALLVTAGFLAVQMSLYERMPYALAQVRRAFAADVAAWPYYQVTVFAVCFVLMCLPTMVAGVIFPATVRVATEQGRMGGRLGRVYAINTLGTLLGAALTGLFFFDWFGVETVMRGVLVAYALAAAGFAALHLRGRARRWAIGAAAALALGHLALYTPADPRLVNLGLYRRNVDLAADFAQFAARQTQKPLIYVGEGPHASVTVREQGRSPYTGGPLRVMTVNGKPDASTGLDMNPQVILGHAPLLFHPGPERIFLLGLGSGVTAGAVSTHGVQLDVAEISQRVVDAQALFEPDNHAPLKNPAVHLYVEDARTVLRFGEGDYDVIISEPTNPWQAGIAGLFTVEFFDQVKARLAPDGVFAQWMHSYETDDAAMRMVLASLQSRFRHVAVFELAYNDYMFLARDEPLHFEPEDFARRWARPAVAADLARVGAGHPWALLAMQVKDPARVPVEAHGPVNSDGLPLLEFQAPRWFFANAESSLLQVTDDNLHLGGTLFADRWRARFGVDAAAVDGLYRLTRPFPLTRARRAALLRLMRDHFGAEDPRVVALERATLVGDPADAGAELGLHPLPAETLGRAALRAQFERAIVAYEGRFHRWAPPPVVPLERLVERLTIAARGDPRWEAIAVRYRLRLLESVCDRATPDCARLSEWFAQRQADAGWRDAWRAALTRDALTRLDLATARRHLQAIAADAVRRPLVHRLARIEAGAAMVARLHPGDDR